jgi:hypothetical protein
MKHYLHVVAPDGSGEVAELISDDPFPRFSIGDEIALERFGPRFEAPLRIFAVAHRIGHGKRSSQSFITCTTQLHTERATSSRALIANPNAPTSEPRRPEVTLMVAPDVDLPSAMIDVDGAPCFLGDAFLGSEPD